MGNEMKTVLIIGLVLMVLVSSGCVGETTYEQPKKIETIADTPAPTTWAPITTTPTSTTTAPPTTTPVPTTQAPPALRTTNPQAYVLTLEDVSSDYRVTKSKYDNLETILDEGAEIGAFNALKDTGFIEGYTVEFTDENETLTVTNIVSRYDSKSSVGKRLDYLKEYYSKKENFPESASFSVLVGRKFGDGSVYSIVTLKQSLLGTDFYYKILSLDFAKENYKINIAMSDLSGNVKLSDLYPYAEILEKRVASDE
jgi:hypothetical protein